MSKVNTILKYTFLVDAVITTGFGLYSFFAPNKTFATIIEIPAENEGLVLEIFSSMSVLYIILGIVCFIGFKATHPVSVWIGLAMIMRHTWIGIMKIMGMNNEWIIGNPYPDIIIHCLYFILYTLGILLLVREKS